MHYSFFAITHLRFLARPPSCLQHDAHVMPSFFTTPHPHPLTALRPHPFIQEKRASSPCATHLLTRDLRKITSLVRCAASTFSAYFSLFETANAPPPAGFSLRPPGGRQETLPPSYPPGTGSRCSRRFPLSSPRSPSHHFRREHQRLKALGARPSLLYAHRGLSLCGCVRRGLSLCGFSTYRPAAPLARNELQGATRQHASASTHQRINAPPCSVGNCLGSRPFLKREKGPKLHASALCVRFRLCRAYAA